MAIVLLLLLAVFAPPVLADTADVFGWSNARWGMSETEVAAAFAGDIVRLEKAEDYRDDYSPLGIDRLQIDGESYNVRFLFAKKTQRLVEVQIQGLDAEWHLFEERFNALEKLLTEKYGTPFQRNDETKPSSSGGTWVNKTRSWKRPSTRIELNYIATGVSKTRVLNVRYRTVKAGPLEKQ